MVIDPEFAQLSGIPLSMSERYWRNGVARVTGNLP